MIVREKLVKVLRTKPDLFSRWNSMSGEIANLTRANLTDANLIMANLTRANLADADLIRANLADADLIRANLTDADLTDANLIGADLTDADLTDANLTRANLADADLIRADLSQCTGILAASDWLSKNFNLTIARDGYIVYRAQQGSFPKPASWVFEPGSYLAEVCNPNRTNVCGCGVSFATLEWIKLNHPGKTVWECVIEIADLPSIIVPYNTDGKARCERLRLVKIIN